MGKGREKRKRRAKKRGRPFEGMEKIFTTKPKRSSTAHKAKGSTWLKTQNPLKKKKVERLGSNL